MARRTIVRCDQCSKEETLSHQQVRPAGWVLLKNRRNGGLNEQETCSLKCATELMTRHDIHVIEFQ
jgi:hypothetical protein